MKTKDIHQTVMLHASPNKVYRSLMNSKIHSAFTGAKAVIGTKPGSTFSVWEGTIHGFTLALEPGKKIVQAWRSDDWPADHYSIVTFALHKNLSGTELVFDQYGVPSEHHKDITDGWKAYYWNPLRELFDPE